MVRPTPASGPDEVKWRKSTFSVTGECVEVAELPGCVAIRNSNDPAAGILILPYSALAEWIAAIKEGQFDDLVD